MKNSGITSWLQPMRNQEKETQLNQARIPDTRKLWDNKCMLFYIDEFGVICYSSIDQ
jgi:hypothetical protein